MMAMVWNIMNNLGEIAVYLPLKGATIPYFVERFVEPSLAFAAGWNYWYAYAILVAGMLIFLILISPLLILICHYLRCLSECSKELPICWIEALNTVQKLMTFCFCPFFFGVLPYYLIANLKCYSRG